MADLSLRELQQRMKARIHAAPEAPPHAPVPLNPQRGTPGEARLSVYAEGYLVRIREALAEVFEAVRHILGEDDFAALAADYAARHPSHDYNLSFSGRHLPAFLTGWRLTGRLPFLPDLAALEWRVCEAFHAFDAAPTDVSALSRVAASDWDRLRLAIQPSAGIVDSAWPILDLWSARQQPRSEIDVAVAGRPQCVLVSCHQDRVRCELIDQPRRRLLEALQAGRTLGEACAAMAELLPADAPPPSLAPWFAAWGRAGLITRIIVP